MQTRLSTKGQVVLPSRIRRKLGLQAGDPLEARVEGGSVVLTPQRKRLQKTKIVTDPVTGLPVLSAGRDAPVLSSKQVEEILSEFP
jgi:AbrB family looped-hinge helix DNA binding protein